MYFSCLGFGVSHWVHLPGRQAGGQAQQAPLLLDDLDDILMLHGVGQAHPLRAVLGAGALGKEQARAATSAFALTKAKATE